MKKFNVTLSFSKNGDFSQEGVMAKDKAEAIKHAANFARGCGWTGTHKKAVAIEIVGGV